MDAWVLEREGERERKEGRERENLRGRVDANSCENGFSNLEGN